MASAAKFTEKLGELSKLSSLAESLGKASVAASETNTFRAFFKEPGRVENLATFTQFLEKSSKEGEASANMFKNSKLFDGLFPAGTKLKQVNEDFELVDAASDQATDARKMEKFLANIRGATDEGIATRIKDLERPGLGPKAKKIEEAEILVDINPLLKGADPELKASEVRKLLNLEQDAKKVDEIGEKVDVFKSLLKSGGESGEITSGFKNLGRDGQISAFKSMEPSEIENLIKAASNENDFGKKIEILEEIKKTGLSSLMNFTSEGDKVNVAKNNIELFKQIMSNTGPHKEILEAIQKDSDYLKKFKNKGDKIKELEELKKKFIKDPSVRAQYQTLLNEFKRVEQYTSDIEAQQKLTHGFIPEAIKKSDGAIDFDKSLEKFKTTDLSDYFNKVPRGADYDFMKKIGIADEDVVNSIEDIQKNRKFFTNGKFTNKGIAELERLRAADGGGGLSEFIDMAERYRNTPRLSELKDLQKAITEGETILNGGNKTWKAIAASSLASGAAMFGSAALTTAVAMGGFILNACAGSPVTCAMAVNCIHHEVFSPNDSNPPCDVIDNFWTCSDAQPWWVKFLLSLLPTSISPNYKDKPSDNESDGVQEFIIIIIITLFFSIVTPIPSILVFILFIIMMFSIGYTTQFLKLDNKLDKLYDYLKQLFDLGTDYLPKKGSKDYCEKFSIFVSFYYLVFIMSIVIIWGVFKLFSNVPNSKSGSDSNELNKEKLNWYHRYANRGYNERKSRRKYLKEKPTEFKNKVLDVIWSLVNKDISDQKLDDIRKAEENPVFNIQYGGKKKSSYKGLFIIEKFNKYLPYLLLTIMILIFILNKNYTNILTKKNNYVN